MFLIVKNGYFYQAGNQYKNKKIKVYQKKFLRKSDKFYLLLSAIFKDGLTSN